MISSLRINLKLVFAFIFVFFFVMASLVFAQSDEQTAAKKYGITFPIGELGGCADLASCKAYCQDPSHNEACIAFAKSKGFYKEKQELKKTELIEAAKKELGCDSAASCKAACEQETNIEKCRTFAQRHNLDAGQNVNKAEIIQKAKDALGCNSEASCKAACAQEANHQKCGEFAHKAGLRGGEVKVGEFCSSSPAICRDIEPTTGRLKERECKEHPERCANATQNKVDTADLCRKNPEKCAKPDQKQRQEFEKKKFEQNRQSPAPGISEQVRGASTENFLQKVLNFFGF